MLMHCEPDRAVNYVSSIQDDVASLGDIFQLSILELVRKASRRNPSQRGKLIRIVFSLAESTSAAVSYDCASTLCALSSSSVALKQALSAYLTLLTEQSDNNVKLIVLDRLQEVRKHHRNIMEGMVMDLLRTLSCPSSEVRSKVMDICFNGALVSPKNVKDVVGLLKKELVKTMGFEAQTVEGNADYRRLLIKALHSLVRANYAEHAQSVMFLLMDLLTENDQTTSTDVVMFLREMIASYPELRTPILQRLCEGLGDVSQSRVLRGCLWLCGEYAEEADLIQEVIQGLLEGLRPLPLSLDNDEQDEAKKRADEAAKKESEGKKPKIT